MIRIIQPEEQFRTNGMVYTKFRDEVPGKEMIFVMHQHENCNNLEVLKLALLLRRENIAMVMFGQRNLLPLFSTFADIMIYPENFNVHQGLYDDADNDQDITMYNPPEVPEWMDAHDITMHDYVDHGGLVNAWLFRAMEEITDDEVIRAFTEIEVQVLQESVDLYDQLFELKQLFDRGSIICELKRHRICKGPKYEEIAIQARNDYGLPFVCDRESLRQLALKCGQSYMAIQCLGADLLEWTWVCDGGSANIFAFFPYKVLAMRDVFVQERLVAELQYQRYGNATFPFFTTEAFFQRLATNDTLFAQQISEYIHSR